MSVTAKQIARLAGCSESYALKWLRANATPATGALGCHGRGPIPLAWDERHAAAIRQAKADGLERRERISGECSAQRAAGLRAWNAKHDAGQRVRDGLVRPGKAPSSRCFDEDGRMGHSCARCGRKGCLDREEPVMLGAVSYGSSLGQCELVGVGRR